MATHSAGLAESDTKHTKRWASKEWFSLIAVLLLLWTGLYLFAHSEYGVQGYEFTKFNNTELRQINNILADPGETTNANNQRSPDSYTNNAYSDTDDFSEPENSNRIQRSRTVVNTTRELSTKEERIRKVMLFLKSQYGEDIHPDQKTNIEEYMREFDQQQVMSFLSGMQLQVRSYFWLTGPKVYAEIIFWVIFGVLCSILFSISSGSRRGNNQFSNRDIIYQFSKIFYAPFLTIIVVLAYSYFKDSTTLNIIINEGVVVLAFFIGIASGAIMEIFDRIKYILFNGSSNNNTQQSQPVQQQQSVQSPPAVTNNFSPIREQVYRPTPPPPPPVDEKPPAPPEEPEKEAPEVEEEIAEDTIEEEQQPEEEPVEEPKVEKEEDSIISTPPQTVVEGKEKRPPHENEIEEVAIDLMLDFSGLFEEEKEELQQSGFSKAIVTLHNVNGKDIIPAKKVTEDMTTFVANNVKPGIYIARATLSQRMRNNQIMNLFGEKTAYITEDKPGLELFVKKYEAIS